MGMFLNITTAMRQRQPKPSIHFLVDTREQLPFGFGPPRRPEFCEGGTRVITLSEGDYSVAIEDGEPLPIRLERKSLGDLYGVIGQGRERFERELIRLQAYTYRAIIVEASLADVVRGFERSQVHPSSAIGSLAAWSVRYNVAIWFAEDHERAGKIGQRLLEAFAINTLRE